AQITKAVISMAHNLNIKVVAEGIETREQLDFLTQSACDEVQGYFISRPIPAEQMLKLLQSFRYKDLIA
ncbi:MAG: EAL domain-containing protein, partial [Gammaproteobacteria bacterium]|nr:EAL domain-containing protein [Gammaproteobacteria bacterium]